LEIVRARCSLLLYLCLCIRDFGIGVEKALETDFEVCQ
jgi:hypothetical protein